MPSAGLPIFLLVSSATNKLVASLVTSLPDINFRVQEVEYMRNEPYPGD